MQVKNRFDSATNKKIMTGALIAGGGVFATLMLDAVIQMDFQEWTPVVVGVCSVLINVIREYTKGTPI